MADGLSWFQQTLSCQPVGCAPGPPRCPPKPPPHEFRPERLSSYRSAQTLCVPPPSPGSPCARPPGRAATRRVGAGAADPAGGWPVQAVQRKARAISQLSALHAAALRPGLPPRNLPGPQPRVPQARETGPAARAQRDETRPVSTGGGTRRVQLVRGGGQARETGTPLGLGRCAATGAEVRRRVRQAMPGQAHRVAQVRMWPASGPLCRMRGPASGPLCRMRGAAPAGRCGAGALRSGVLPGARKRTPGQPLEPLLYLDGRRARPCACPSAPCLLAARRLAGSASYPRTTALSTDNRPIHGQPPYPRTTALSTVNCLVRDTGHPSAPPPRPTGRTWTRASRARACARPPPRAPRRARRRPPAAPAPVHSRESAVWGEGIEGT